MHDINDDAFYDRIVAKIEAAKRPSKSTGGDVVALKAEIEQLRLENGHRRARANIILGWCKVEGKESVLTAPIIELLESPIKVTNNE
jgi:hypothetical protein